MGRIEFYQDKRNEWRWRIRHLNSNILAVSSEGYKNRIDCVTAAQTVATILSKGTIG